MSAEILIVDDEDDIRELLAGTLEDEGYATRKAASADEAIAALRYRRPALVLLDIWLEGSDIDGLGLLEMFHESDPTLPIVMISGHGTVEIAVSAIKNGAYDFIEKPFKVDRLLLVVQRAIEASRLRREIAELRQRAGAAPELVGSSSAIQGLHQIIDKVAPTSSRVLIAGGPGVGKEVVARLIHASSARAAGPFVVLNCATMHPERMEAALFGVEAGSGQDGKVGTLELAHGGTLLLDEVCDMPLETQGKILRVLQDQRFERLGGDGPIEVDVRVIASTGKNLQEEIAAGNFREDLYYRLNVVPIEVPPLRLRRTDIPELVAHFMSTAAQRSGLPPQLLTTDALAALQAYHWPGNVRQLSNVVDWLLIMHPQEEGRAIDATKLPPEISGAAPVDPRWQKSGEIMTLPLREARETFEREYLVAQISRFGGNISRTAEFVGMERSALHRKLKSLGVGTGERSGNGARGANDAAFEKD